MAAVEYPIQHELARLVSERIDAWAPGGCRDAHPSSDDLAALAFYLRTLPVDDANVAALAALVPVAATREFPSRESLRLVRGFGRAEPADADVLMARLVEAEVAASLRAWVEPSGPATEPPSRLAA
jgi:hypothetical protein